MVAVCTQCVDHVKIDDLVLAACDQAKRLFLPLDLLSAPGDRCCPYTARRSLSVGAREVHDT